MILREEESLCVYSSSERAVKITLLKTRQDDSQRRPGSVQNRLIHVIEKKKYQGGRGDTQRGGALTQQHSENVYKFVINCVQTAGWHINISWSFKERGH